MSHEEEPAPARDSWDPVSKGPSSLLNLMVGADLNSTPISQFEQGVATQLIQCKPIRHKILSGYECLPHKHSTTETGHSGALLCSLDSGSRSKEIGS